MMVPTTVPATPRARRPVAARAATVAVLAWLALALAAAPAGAQYPPQPEIAVGTPGAVIFIEGTDWSPNTQVTITYRDQDGQARTAAVTTTAGPDGRFSARVPIPADAAPGELPLSVTGTGADGTAREWTPIARVVPDAASRPAAQAPPEATPAPALPATGAPTAPGLVAAGVLLALGAGALLAARARSRG